MARTIGIVAQLLKVLSERTLQEGVMGATQNDGLDRLLDVRSAGLLQEVKQIEAGIVICRVELDAHGLLLAVILDEGLGIAEIEMIGIQQFGMNLFIPLSQHRAAIAVGEGGELAVHKLALLIYGFGKAVTWLVDHLQGKLGAGSLGLGKQGTLIHTGTDGTGSSQDSYGSLR